MRRIAVLLILAVVMLGAPAGAIGPDEPLADPALEARARALSKELRCLVCQNQSIDDSDAALARDLRLIVRERIMAGDSDGEAMAFITERYGDYVRFRPVMAPRTLILWFGPLAALLIGAAVAAIALRRGRLAPAGPAESLSRDEAARLDAVLARLDALPPPPGGRAAADGQ